MPDYLLRPNADFAASWTETPAGAAWSCIDDAVEQPDLPDLSDHLETVGAGTGVKAAVELTALPTLAAGETIDLVQAFWCVEIAGGTRPVVLAVGQGGIAESDPVALTVGTGSPPVGAWWYSITAATAKTESWVNTAELMATTGGTGATARVYAAYLRVVTTISPLADRVLSLDPALYWRLDDAGPTATDISGNGRDGTKSGTVTFGKAAVNPNADGGSAKFSSERDTMEASGFVATGYKPYIVGSQRTFEAWLKFTAPALVEPRGEIVSASNATPIVITTSENHELETDDAVRIAGVAGNAAANNGLTEPSPTQTKPRWWYVTRLGATTFSLQAGEATAIYAHSQNSVGTGAGTGGDWRYYITSFPTLFAGNGMDCISGTITGATNATPIEITTSATHHLEVGDLLSIAGVGGNTATNGTRRVRAVTASNKVTLNTNANPPVAVAGNGTYTSGGTWQLTPETPHPTLEWGNNAEDETAFARWYARVMTFPAGWHDNAGGFNGAGGHRFTTGEAHHVVWRWDDDEHRGDLVIDGISCGRIGPLDVFGAALIRWEDPVRGDPGDFTLGYRGNGVWDFESMDGYIGDVAIYERLLTDLEIQGNFAAGGGHVATPPDASKARGTTPRLDLTIEAIVPEGRRYRWSGDERDPERTASGISFSTSVPGGFDRLEVSLTRDPRIDYADLERLTTLRALGPGGEVAGEYRLESAPRSTGLQTMDVSPNAVGWQAHLSDDETFTETYIGRDLDHWGEITASFRAAILDPTTGSAGHIGQLTVDADRTNGLPQLTLTYGAEPTAAAFAIYDMGRGSKIRRIYAEWDAINVGDAGMVAYAFWSLDDDAFTGGPGFLFFNPAGPTVSGTLDEAPPDDEYAYRYAFLAHRFLAATRTDTPSAALDHTLSLRHLTVYGGSMVPFHGTAPNDGVYASDVIKDMLGRAAPMIRYTEDSITDSGFIIPHLAYHEPLSAADVVIDVNRYHGWPWAVWEDPGGRPNHPTFYYHPPGQGVRRWSVRAGPANLQEAGPQLERLFNGVLVSFTDVSGITLTVGPPGSSADVTDETLADADPENPANQLGIRRWTRLDMGGVATIAAAAQIGGLFMQLQKEADQSGSATLTGTVLDDKGVEHPAWLVRAGDLIRFTDAAGSYRKIVRTNYDDTSKTNAVDLDVPPDYLETVLQRLGVSIKPLGF